MSPMCPHKMLLCLVSLSDSMPRNTIMFIYTIVLWVLWCCFIAVATCLFLNSQIHCSSGHCSFYFVWCLFSFVCGGLYVGVWTMKLATAPLGPIPSLNTPSNPSPAHMAMKNKLCVCFHAHKVFLLHSQSNTTIGHAKHNRVNTKTDK